MKLLIATDHQYIFSGEKVFDKYCFDRHFFDDYRTIFERVEVLCRIKQFDHIPEQAKRSDGDGVSFIGVPPVHGFRWLTRNQSIVTSVIKAVNDADVVIARVPSQLGWYAAKYAKSMGKPYMVEVIGDPLASIKGIGRGPHYVAIARREAWRLKILARDAAVASYVSRDHLQRAYPTSKETPTASVSSIRLGGETLVPARMFSDITARRLRVILVASLVPLKRHRDIIEATRLAVKAGLDMELHFAGDGETRSSLERMVDKYGLEGRVCFHGHISDKNKLTDLLDRSDVFVMASVSEGLPRAAVEAMARGLPVIGSRISGLEEIVRPSELFPVRDYRALASLLQSVGRDSVRLHEMSKHSVEVARQYTSEILTPRRLYLFEELRKSASPALKF